jgi:hypothetical protein
MYNRLYALSTIILVIHKVFMKAKMGRPKVAKAKKRGIFIVTRVSPEENSVISGAIRRAGQSQSEWARKALLSAAGSDKSAS